MVDIQVKDPEIEALITQKNNIENQIIEKQKAKKLNIIVQIVEAMKSFNITAKELNAELPKELKLATRAKKVSTIEAKYYNPANKEETWSGRGVAPAWAKTLKANNELDNYKL